MSTETITLLNFLFHSLVIGAAAWLLVRFVIRDALRRCILANLAVLMCLYCPFDISMRDLFPVKQHVPVLTPIRETFEHDWRVTVEPQGVIKASEAVATPAWNVNDLVKWLPYLSWLVTAILLIRLLVQSIRVQRWAWRLRCPSSVEHQKLPADLSPERVRVFDHAGTPCAAGWFSPVIAVPASAFEELTPRQWRWLIRHEAEHLRCNDTVAVLLQNIVLAFLWWNPFVHALIEEYARAREEACDAAAVGADREQDDYADFLIAWAAKASPQSSCVMPIARSRPARRLKARLVALMEARGVRKKLGALFVLGCLAFAVITPFVAASFGIATAAAQEPEKPRAKDDGAMHTRVYRVAPDFLNADSKPAANGLMPRKSARQILEAKGVPFPEDATVAYNPATSQLVVRNTVTNLDLVEKIVDAIHTRPVLVHVTCKLVQAEQFFGTHEEILSAEDYQKLIRGISQVKGVDLMTSPTVTTKLDQRAIIEVVREVLPKTPPSNKTGGDLKLVGPSIQLIAKPGAEGKALIQTKVDLGVDLDATTPWRWEKDKVIDWDRVQTFTVGSTSALATGETLLLHLQTANKPVTVFITAEALKPDGSLAKSFAETTLAAPPAREGHEMPDKAASEWAVRVYKLPQSFPQDKPPVEVLKAAGIAFPKGADAALKDGKLTVRNAKPNLEFIGAWLDAMMHAEAPKKHVHLTVKAVEVKGDFSKMMTEWLEPSTSKVEAAEPPVDAIPPPPAVLRQFTVAGILTAPQFEKVIKRLAVDAGVKLEVIKPKQKSQMYDLPAALGGHELKIEPVIGPDGNTIEMLLRVQNTATAITSSVTIWDGQTVLLSAQPTEGVSRVLFITGQLVAPLAKK